MSSLPLPFAQATPPAPHLPPNQHLLEALPRGIEKLLWRGTELSQNHTQVRPSGWQALDAELPGGGWPTHAVTEVLAAQPAVLEWRLLGPSLRAITADGSQVVVVGPPRVPHLPGLLHEGLDERNFIWIQADKPAERLWVTEQLIKANAAGAIVAWLPQARQEQLRRLQVCAQACEALVFLCRPQATRHEASAAPLRLQAAIGLDWQLHVEVFKRRGPAHDGTLTLPSIPGGLASVLTPRLLKPSTLIHREASHAVGRTATAAPSRQRATI